MIKNIQKELIVRFLCKSYPNLIAIYLFGSSEQGTMNKESDIDVAILPVCPLSSSKRWSLSQGLAVLLNREVDLVDLRSTSTVMRMQVISTGICLYDGDRRERNRFEDYVFSSYARLNEERREIIKDIRAKGKVYG